MLFELPTNTECELTTFVGRTQKSGPEDVPAVTFRLKLSGVSNILLDRFSKTIRHTVYKAVEGQEQLPGMEDTTPLLQSKDLVHWAPETCLEGWRVFVARGISDGGALQMGSCKVDNFRFDFFEGGRMDVDFRVGTANIDEEGAGMLWGRQKRKVFVTIIAPEMPAPAIDGSVDAFKRDHPEAGQAEAGDLFAEQHGDGPDDADGAPGAGDSDEAAEPSRGDAWPFPDAGGAAEPAADGDGLDAEVAAFEAGAKQAVAKAGGRGRRSRNAASVE